MKLTDLGKNGDEIRRLFDEPADLLILQHCHHVTAQVHNMMETYAADFRNIRRYCIIDGPTTLRILKENGKM